MVVAPSADRPVLDEAGLAEGAEDAEWLLGEADIEAVADGGGDAGTVAAIDAAQGHDGAADEAFEWREARIGREHHGERLDKALVALAPEFSRSHLQGLIADGHVWIDARAAGKAAQRLEVGQRLRVQLVPTAESLAYRPEALPLEIVYEDAHLLVIDKPAGLVVHPAPGHWSGTLLNALLAHHAGAAALPRAGIVHRLDKDTSGLMVVGKTLPAVTALVRAIAARQVSRRYLALVHGAFEPAEQSVEAPIGRDPRSRIRMAVVPERAGGRAARTDFCCVAQAHVESSSRTPMPVRAVAGGIEPVGGAGPGGGRVSALRCTLHTGRTHQIRVHAASRGHPLLADALYGGRAALDLARQALHAAELGLAHPITGEPLVWHRAPPPDFAAAWDQVVRKAGSRPPA
jgi:23S rRNA pseudouridine1911/1915/1917 synthase